MTCALKLKIVIDKENAALKSMSVLLYFINNSRFVAHKIISQEKIP